jgi:hypothetical protein
MNMSETQHLIEVREATEADLPVYLRLSADFHAASPMQRVCKFEPEGFEAFVLGAMQNPDICILLAELNGEIVGITGRHHLSACIFHRLTKFPKNCGGG